MIDNGTPDRIAQLGTTIADATEELERIFRELSTEADAQLALAAAGFLAQHGNAETNNPLLASYAAARKRLHDAGVASSNIAELTGRSSTVRGQCAWWDRLMATRQQGNDIRSVCSHAVPVATDTQGCGGPPVASDRQATQ